MSDPDLLDAPVRDFLQTLADDRQAPAGGSAAAIAVAMAAGLVGMVARLSKEHWDEAGAVIGQAEALRARVAPLAQADAEAYRAALAALRGEQDVEHRYRDIKLGAALDKAAEIPLEIAEAGADLASLAALLVEHGNPTVRADAAAAAVLAEGGCRAAAKLVMVNLASLDGDERVAVADALVKRAAEASKKALSAAE